MDAEVSKKTEPDRSDAWNKGYSAAGFGADRSANHFPAGSDEAAEWEEGFAQWLEDSQPKKDA